MSQAERQQADQRKADEESIERERASGNKLWSAYISEAQNYDQGLIEGWRSEMDGLLIFAGLFSGVVTTFIIDSYKTLNPDSSSQTVVLLSQTVALLSQISHQLGNPNHSTAVMDALPPPLPSHPRSYHFALVATLVKQWAQEYQHRTSMFSSPSVRARVYMYLYYGLRRFNMHAVVGVPPLLLHASLVLFFAGLVAFLVPINVIIMGISSALLLLFVSIYGTFSALPLFRLDCPYQTPLTPILWSLNQSLRNRRGTSLPRAVAVCEAFFRKRVAEPDLERPAQSTVMNPATSTEPSTPAETRPQSQSIVEALKSAALHPPVETETRALAWIVRSLSDDDELEKLVEGLPQTLWDFDRNKPRGVYQALFKRLLQDPQVHLGQRLADFMAGSNSNLLEDKVRLRRQLSVLRAIWAICAFSLHTGSPLQSPIGEADMNYPLIGSKFLDSPGVQSMVTDVSALIRLNMIESRSRGRASIQPSSSDGDIRAQRQADIQQTYVDYLEALSKRATSFQRDVTNSLLHWSQMQFTEADGYETLRSALSRLIQSKSDETANNTVFAARQMINAFAQTSNYSDLFLPGLGPFLIRYPSLAASDQRSDLHPASKHHYTRYLCHQLCRNLSCGIDPQPSADALQLIYRNLLESNMPPRDLDTHVRVLRTLRTQAAEIPTHRLAAIVHSVVLNSFLWDLCGWEQLPSIFDDEEWFRAVIGLDNDERTERPSAQLVYGCAYVGLFSTFFEQCTAQSPNQTDQDMDLATLKLVQYRVANIRSVIPVELQNRFADAASAFIRKYPKDCLADEHVFSAVLYSAVDEHDGYITNLDALRVLDTAVSEVQADNQQKSHRDNAQRIRRYMQARLERNWERMQKPLLPPEDIFAAFIPLMSDAV
ncbi:unnamed protein product [Mycena citricolor]|uniref:DUF6535 domain-containing protein n=1 Tax=Mycena citricolor TaxID=2018698 RepID=A0AAD2K4E7_9AGAR|nr:unnamed protein product [Mycena citricolor]